ncbi:MAG: 3-methyl-2-oxobutanoate hydroxymethyltransferase [Methylococcaceae bacterium]|nr:MAG: 3-methyl-2-oxobutanoate hydroxymethyltransferase [Methylococcaceae bacterium]
MTDLKPLSRSLSDSATRRLSRSLSDSATRRLSVPELTAMKQRGEKITCLTAYDAGFARVLEDNGVDVLLVGDSLGMVVQGHASTLPVGMDDMVYHCAAVSRASRRALVVADLPFMSYSTSEQAAANAARLLQQGGAHMVKLEGGYRRAAVVHHLVDQGIPVCGHLGLLPQSIHQLGGYKVQGKTEKEAERLIEEASLLEETGISLLVLECIPAALAAEITAQLRIPTIGIGAGNYCDGQVLVLYDMLGLTPNMPRFCRDFLHGADGIAGAVANYVAAVRSGQFPDAEHSY